MFRSKRNSFVKRLWKLRVLTQNETRGQIETDEDLEIKSVIHSVLKRLKERQLDILVQSLESKGGEVTDCVSVPRAPIRLGRKGSIEPQIMCCQLWRWPHVDQNHRLKALPCCNTCPEDPAFVCCNPYHWSILMEAESPPPPYTKDQPPQVSPQDTQAEPQTPVSTETGGTPTALCCPSLFTDAGDLNQSRQREVWCNIAYWELRQRVGRLYSVCEQSVNIFQDLPRGDGMCLKILQDINTSDNSIKRTRDKIGFGVTLFRENDSVWVYNRSMYPVFVNSPTLDVPNTRMVTVHKVPSGYAVKMFDYCKAAEIQRSRNSQYTDGPYDPNAVRISFAKGWGGSYSRQFIISCPCWLEILLTVKR